MPIYFLCTDDEVPFGGIRTIYRHADILRRHGFDAYVVQERRGFRYRWTKFEAPVLGWSNKRYRRKSSSLPARIARRGGSREGPGPVDRAFGERKGRSTGPGQ